MSPFVLFWLVVVTALAIAGAAGGLWLTGAKRQARGVLPFSGGLLVGISLFWLLPELGEYLHPAVAAALLAGGFLTLWAIDRYIYPVCPSCSHTHDHDDCDTRLHGFGAPLITAAIVHSFLDGWGIASAQVGGSSGLGAAFLLGAVAHKLPEGLAYGALLRASLASRSSAFGWVVFAELMTVLGGVAETVAAPYLSMLALHSILALAAGTFLYLGYHAVHNEWKRRGKPAVFPALTGAAGAAALQQGLRVFLR